MKEISIIILFFRELTGVVIRLDPVRRSRANAPPRVKLFRCILSNLQGRLIRLLFWEERANEYESRVYRRYIRICRARIVLANAAYADPTEDLMPIEVSIQRNSTVTILGCYEDTPAIQRVVYQEVALQDVGRVEGAVRLTVYMRVAIEEQRYGNASYGSGAITDGFYRLRVNVTAFNPAQSPPVGAHVIVEGELRRDNFNAVLLQVSDMNAIRVMDDIIMDPVHLRNGFRVPPNREALEDAAVVPIRRVDAPPVQLPVPHRDPVGAVAAPIVAGPEVRGVAGLPAPEDFHVHDAERVVGAVVALNEDQQIRAVAGLPAPVDAHVCDSVRVVATPPVVARSVEDGQVRNGPAHVEFHSGDPVSGVDAGAIPAQVRGDHQVGDDAGTGGSSLPAQAPMDLEEHISGVHAESARPSSSSATHGKKVEKRTRARQTAAIDKVVIVVPLHLRRNSGEAVAKMTMTNFPFSIVKALGRLWRHQ